MADLPFSSLNIFGTNWKVVIEEGFSLTGDKNWADTDHEQKIITLDADCPLAVYLLHENHHAIEDSFDLDAAKEDHVQHFARGMFAIFVENPTFTEWFFQQVKAAQKKRDV